MPLLSISILPLMIPKITNMLLTFNSENVML